MSDPTQSCKQEIELATDVILQAYNDVYGDKITLLGTASIEELRLKAGYTQVKAGLESWKEMIDRNAKLATVVKDDLQHEYRRVLTVATTYLAAFKRRSYSKPTIKENDGGAIVANWCAEGCKNYEGRVDLIPKERAFKSAEHAVAMETIAYALGVFPEYTAAFQEKAAEGRAR